MKKAVNIRLDERVVFTLNQLSKELNITKTEIIEKAIEMFSKNRLKKKNKLLEFAGILKKKEAENMLKEIKNSKNIKEFELDI